MSFSTSLCSTQPSLQVENVICCIQNHPLDGGMLDVNPVYFTLWGSEAKQPEYMNMAFNKYKNQKVPPEDHPSQQRTCIQQIKTLRRGIYQSQEVILTYVQTDQSKNEISQQTVNETEKLYSIRNEKPQNLFPSEKVKPVHAQPDLSKKKKYLPFMNPQMNPLLLFPTS